MAKTDLKTVRRKRIRHYDGDGCPRALTFSCFRRRPFLAGDLARGWLIHALDFARRRHPIELWAYVAMPEHVHVVVWPKVRNFRISVFLSTLKQSVAKKARNHLLTHKPDVLRRAGGHFHFWQDGPGYDRNIDSDFTLWQTIDYIHMNPVRRQLCTRPEDWPWSSAGFYLGGAASPIIMDQESLPADPR